jgi:antitoxin PrlF
MASATLTSKWQMVIPKQVREHLGVQPGDQLDFLIQDDGQVIVRPAVVHIKELKGILSRTGAKAVTTEHMNRVVHRRARRSA